MHKDFTLKVKALDDSGTFTGLASTYGPPADLMGDIIAPGAYRQALEKQGKGFPLLWAHLQSEPIGLAKLSDSPAGLVVNGSLLLTDPAAVRAYEHLKNGSIKAMSIGYSLPHGEGKISYADDGTRTLKEIFLHEISLVAVPANQGALVSTVKTLGEIESVLRTYRPGQVTAEDLEHIRSIDLTLKSLLRKDALCECECPECLADDCENCSDPECTDPNCEGTKAREAETLKALQQFSVKLKQLVA